MAKHIPVNKEYEDKNVVSMDPSDPLTHILAILEKKYRNLEKRKIKGIQLKELLDSGKQLNDDQKGCARGVNEVDSNLELIKELSVAVSNVRLECISAIKEKLTAQAPPSSPAIKIDTIRLFLDYQNNFKKLSDFADKMKELNSMNPKLLAQKEVDLLLAFWKLILPSQTPDTIAKIKKMAHYYTLLLNKDQRLVNADIGLTYQQIEALYQKIDLSVHAVKSQSEQASKPVVVPKEEIQIIPPPAVVPSTENSESDGWMHISGSSNDRRRRESHAKQHQKTTDKPVAKVTDIPVKPKTTGTLIIVKDVPVQHRDKARGGEKNFLQNGQHSRNGAPHSFRSNNGGSGSNSRPQHIN